MIQEKAYLSKLHGFTLVEVMVVMAMISIMVAVTLVTIGDARDKKIVEGEARKLSAVMRELQNYALTGKQMVANQVTCGVGIEAIANGATSYAPFYTYRTGTDCSTPSANTPLTTNTLLPGVTFSTATGVVSFSVPRGEVNGAPARIGVSKGSVVYSVCLYQSGRIEDVSGATCP